MAKFFDSMLSISIPGARDARLKICHDPVVLSTTTGQSNWHEELLEVML